LIVDSLRYSLRREGFEVQAARNGEQALKMVQSFSPDLVVLDVMLPDISGLDVCRQLRLESAIPVIMLTARGDEIDRVLGLEIGADDYLAKPFSFRELLARIRAVLRRVELEHQTNRSESLQIGQITLEPQARRVLKGGEEIQLSAREFDLLAHLMRSAGKALSREKLMDEVWGKHWVGDPRTLDVHIRWLRLKIEPDPASPRYIQTVRGFGYRFVSPEELL
jgi:DNA-binding response OmpR family regulator